MLGKTYAIAENSAYFRSIVDRREVGSFRKNATSAERVCFLSNDGRIATMGAILISVQLSRSALFHCPQDTCMSWTYKTDLSPYIRTTNYSVETNAESRRPTCVLVAARFRNISRKIVAEFLPVRDDQKKRDNEGESTSPGTTQFAQSKLLQSRTLHETCRCRYGRGSSRSYERTYVLLAAPNSERLR